MLQAVIELSITAVVIVFIVTQLVIPAIRDTKLFPLFSRERRKLERQRVATHEQWDILEEANKLKRGKQK